MRNSYKDFIFLSFALILIIAFIDTIYLIYKAATMKEVQMPLPILVAGMIVIICGLVVNFILYKKHKKKDL